MGVEYSGGAAACRFPLPLGFLNRIGEEVRLMVTVAFVRREIDFFGHANLQ